MRRLRRTSASIYHAGGVHAPKPLFPIIGGILAERVDWVDGFEGTLLSNMTALTLAPP